MGDNEKALEVHGSAYLKSDETSGVNLAMPLTQNDRNIISAIAAADFGPNIKLQSATGGVGLNNMNNGHAVALTATHIPDFGNQLTAAGRANIVRNDNHDLSANAFVTRNMPTIPHVPDFNTVGGSVDYMFKDKAGASVGCAHTPFLQRTHYSATSNLKLLQDRSTSLELNAGVHKTVSPFTKGSVEPKVGITLRKFFK